MKFYFAIFPLVMADTFARPSIICIVVALSFCSVVTRFHYLFIEDYNIGEHYFISQFSEGRYCRYCVIIEDEFRKENRKTGLVRSEEKKKSE